MNAVDVFVYHDDVQYIKGGWINRNRILAQNGDKMFTFSIVKDSHEKKINERIFADLKKDKERLLSILQNNYSYAPYFDTTFNIIHDALNYADPTVSKFINNANRKITEYLELNTKIYISSQLKKDDTLNGEKRVINICKNLGAAHYINPQGGIELYTKENFSREGLKLSFLILQQIKYYQNRNDNEFIPNLSIIDVMMFNSKEEIKKLLTKYDLV